MDQLILGDTADSWRFKITVNDDWGPIALPHRDDATGQPAKFLTDPSAPWSAKLDITTDAGALLARLSTTPGTGINGTLTLDDQGNVWAHLPASFTATLSPTVSFDSSVGWRATSAVKGALRLTGSDGGSPWTRTTYLGTGLIYPQEVTS